MLVPGSFSHFHRLFFFHVFVYVLLDLFFLLLLVTLQDVLHYFFFVPIDKLLQSDSVIMQKFDKFCLWLNHRLFCFWIHQLSVYNCHLIIDLEPFFPVSRRIIVVFETVCVLTAVFWGIPDETIFIAKTRALVFLDDLDPLVLVPIWASSEIALFDQKLSQNISVLFPYQLFHFYFRTFPVYFLFSNLVL